MRIAMRVKIVHCIHDVVRGKPDVVRRQINRSLTPDPECLADVLKQQGRLSRPLRSLETDQPITPVNLPTQVAAVCHIDRRNHSIRRIQYAFNI